MVGIRVSGKWFLAARASWLCPPDCRRRSGPWVAPLTFTAPTACRRPSGTSARKPPGIEPSAPGGFAVTMGCKHHATTAVEPTRTGPSKVPTVTSSVRLPMHWSCAGPRNLPIPAPIVPSLPRLSDVAMRAAPSASTPNAGRFRICHQRGTDYEETSAPVASTSGFILKRVFYTVPSRLIGHRLGVRLYDDRLELYVGGIHQLTLPRKHRGASMKAVHVVNYRHVIHSLKMKPMALLNLVYRDELFPREAYRRCFERAFDQHGERVACRMTVRLLALAHEQNCEAALAAEIDDCLRAGQLPDMGRLKSRFAPASGAMLAIGVIQAPLAGTGDLLGTGAAL